MFFSRVPKQPWFFCLKVLQLKSFYGGVLFSPFYENFENLKFWNIWNFENLDFFYFLFFLKIRFLCLFCRSAAKWRHYVFTNFWEGTNLLYLPRLREDRSQNSLFMLSSCYPYFGSGFEHRLDQTWAYLADTHPLHLFHDTPPFLKE